MATYVNKFILASDSYSGRRSFHDTLDEAKAYYDVLMADEVYMSFDEGDINYHIIPGVIKIEL